MTTNAYIDIPGVARQVIKEIGYENSEIGFDWKTCGILVSIQEQSQDIAMGVSRYQKNNRKKLAPEIRGLCMVMPRNGRVYADLGIFGA